MGSRPRQRTIHEKELDMRRIWLFAAGLLLLPLAGCTHETTPDEAMKVMAEGLANNKPVVYWDGLPASYQKDVESLLKEFAEKMDPEIWNKGLAAANNLVQVLDEKKEYIQQNPMLERYVEPEVAAENWDEAVKVISIFVKSDASDLDKLKTLDVKEFLSTTGADLMEHMPALVAITKREWLKNIMQEYKAANFKLLTLDGDKATIEIALPNKEPEVHEMVKIEGKWIPQEIADYWASDMEQARQQLAGLSQLQNPQAKQQLLANIQMVDSYLKLLKGAKSADEFNGQVGVIFMMLAMNGQGNSRASSPPSAAFLESHGLQAAPSDTALPTDDRESDENSPAGDLSTESSSERARPAEYTTDEDPLFDAPATKPVSKKSASEPAADEVKP
jgi:hypothetical protein